MTNWKELGEIPDSEDDEGFDSQQFDSQPLTTGTGVAPVSDLEPDVWDFPESPKDKLAPIQKAPNASNPTDKHALDSTDSSPLSSVPSDDGLPPVDDFVLGDNNHDNAVPSQPGGLESESPLPTQNWRTSVFPADFALSPEASMLEDDALSHEANGSRQIGEIAEAQRVAARYERSLRPRKPIQEHPYLLENAQYSSFLKLHGVKPLRMAIENERKKRDGQHGLSQDDNFQEESQESGEPDTFDAFLIDRNDAAGHSESPAMPSSTPLQQSPIGGLVGVSSPLSSQGDTDNTSVLDQDLPAIDELLTKPPIFTSIPANKRNATPCKSSARKRRRRNVIDSDPVEDESVQAVSASNSPSSPFSPSLHAQRNLQISPRRKPSHLVLHRSPLLFPTSKPSSPTSANKHGAHTSSDNESQEYDIAPENSHRAPSDSDGLSASETEAVTAMSRRIHGVLPASWLRLDKQTGRDKAKRSLQSRSRLHRSPGREQKRGVAQLRHATHESTSLPIFYDESDGEDGGSVRSTNGDQFDSQARLVINSTEVRTRELHMNFEDDDDCSVVEDNGIDFMLASSGSSRKRQLKLTDSLDRGTKKRPRGTDHALKQHPRKQQQTKITTHPTGSGTRRISGLPFERSQRRQPSTHKRNRPAPRTVGKQATSLPPRLSILDTIQPDAPRFLKIAARAARLRRNQGRSSPRTKTIQLATRQDQLDAVSVLHSWRSGLIKQRDSVTAATKFFSKQTGRSVLREASGNQAVSSLTMAHPRNDTSRKLVKQVSDGGSIQFLPNQPLSQRQNSKITQKMPAVKRTPFLSSTRPAQLEAEESAHLTKFEFNSRKRFLDRLYQNQRSALLTRGPRSETSSSIPSVAPSKGFSMQDVTRPQTNKSTKRLAAPRIRKKAFPKRINVEEPQYSHAKDPVPERYSAEPVVASINATEAKLAGLGPYGTRYTHHFEIFPLHPDVFFHESTLIGSGLLQSCATFKFPLNWSETRAHVFLHMNNHIFRWGYWNDQASSEIGVVFDHIAEYMEAQLANKHDTSSNETTPVQAVNFVLSYVKGSISFAEEGQKLSFTSRVRECMETLNNRVDSAIRTATHFTIGNIGQVLQIYDRLLLTAFLVLKFCSEDPVLMAEQFSMEKLLQSVGGTTIAILVELGIRNLQDLYAKLDNRRLRECGIGNDSPIIHSWVVAMKVFDLAQIPRASFWDVVQCRIVSNQDSSIVNAQDHERIWEQMFTLLPLVEFSHTGVLLPGKRHDASSDGWGIPQKLLRQVFRLYERNPRQAASFNNYCRALVGRCHYLVQEWGWRKCVSIIGLVFDFFGSQQLAHLRNEEVYSSPRFLENLGGSPSLDIEPEDRCFHVFLKLVAVAIKKFVGVGSHKDIGNLVTRTVPNHDRQHRKDENVHARDLAALRNHHDLLCTLFWAAPSEYRPSPALIQSLVDPADSHKEACLINLRAWTQLARFVISSGEATTSWKPFHIWRGSFFDQVLEQFNSVASEVALQLSALGKEASHSITEEMVNTTVAVNKAALMDVLYASSTASLDVVKHAPDLATATFAWNITQLRTTFTHFSVTPPDLSWEILKECLATLESMLSKIDNFKADEESQQSESQILNSAVADDALLLLDNELSKAFFGMARCVLSSCLNKGASHAARAQASCTEQIVILAARMIMRFLNGGLMLLSGAFKGNYQVFAESPLKLNLHQRRYMVLFISTLLRYDVDDFDAVGFSLSDIWILALSKPRQSLGYEIELGKELHRHGKLFVPETIAGLSVQPNYSTNRDLLEYAISSMRKSVQAAGPSFRGILTSEYSSALKLAMVQIKADLKDLVQSAAKDHNNYVVFVHDVISIIKTHASDICAVDNYFCQISKEYSPSTKDPQLQVASLKSYGLRLQEGDTRIGQRLFHLLFNNAKFSIFHSKLGEEVDMLRKGMSNSGIKTFILSKMLPAVVKAAFKEHDAFPLLDIYLEVLGLCFASKAMPLELTPDDLPAICTLVQAMQNGMELLYKDGVALIEVKIHLVRQMVGLGNLLWPSLYVLSRLNLDSRRWKIVWGLLSNLRDTISANMEGYLQNANGEEMETRVVVQAEGRLMGIREAQSEEDGFDSDAASFAENIIQDVRKNWKVAGGHIAIHIPGQNRGAVTSPSVAVAEWTLESLLDELNEGIKEWIWWWHKANGVSCLKHPVSVVF